MHWWFTPNTAHGKEISHAHILIKTNALAYVVDAHRNRMKGQAANGDDGNGGVEEAVKAKVKVLCDRFPIYESL